MGCAQSQRTEYGAVWREQWAATIAQPPPGNTQLAACCRLYARAWLALACLHSEVGLRPQFSLHFCAALAAVIPLYFYLRPPGIYESNAADVWIAKLCGVTAAGCSVFLLPPVTKTLTDYLR